MLNFIVGDIFTGNEKYLLHQTNCKTKTASGIAKTIFKKFPYSDCYSNRNGYDVPGTIKIFGNGKNQRYIINLFGQYEPGKVNEFSAQDKSLNRQMYFHDALIALSKVEDLQSVSFPAGIGCNVAGGNWQIYYSEICEFHFLVNKNQKVDVNIYCLPSNVDIFKI